MEDIVKKVQHWNLNTMNIIVNLNTIHNIHDSNRINFSTKLEHTQKWVETMDGNM